jgi:hypothetical protein
LDGAVGHGKLRSKQTRRDQRILTQDCQRC